tara:strand:+ start:4207 stop:4677 length:471 start_codon:yes stop_codon:yes gene_type:complete
MVVAETLAGIALVKSAVSAIKGGIDTAKDIGSVAKDIDRLFEGEKQIQKFRADANSNPFSVKSVAEETINAKLAQEQMDEMRQLIDMRFGHGTWAGIIAERARRIQQQKEAVAEAKREKIRQQQELMKDMASFGWALGGLALIAVVLGFVWKFGGR